MMKAMCWHILRIALCGGILAASVATGRAGDLRIGNDVKAVGATAQGFTLQFSLSWENSWYDAYNFDAVWCFVKYKTPGMRDWLPLTFYETGHVLTDDGQYLAGTTGSEVVGLFLYKGVAHNGKVEMNCRLQCPLPLDVSQEDVAQNRVYFAVQGIEMAYVPAGPYYLGDGQSTATLGDAGGRPLLVAEEEAELTVYDINGGEYILPAECPKGYQGFFCMKTEVSQGQYVTFLNMLSSTQQYAVIANLRSLTEGNFVFNNSRTAPDRNGIVLRKKSTSSTVASVFMNDLNGNGVPDEDDDGQTIACNYLTLKDMNLYCAWAGLRPMSELEFEKACRPPFPASVAGGEYVWNKTSGAAPVATADIAYVNTPREQVSGTTKNVNATGTYAGPLKVGAFAATPKTPLQSGATCWGLLEMSGNLRELCISVSGGDFFTSDCGAGDAGAALWDGFPCTARGGDYTSGLPALRVADRSGAELADPESRQPTLGFRAVRPLAAGTPGSITTAAGQAVDTVCQGVICNIKSVATAAVSGDFTYAWLMKKSGSDWEIMPGKTGASLEYTPELLPVGLSEVSFRRMVKSRLGNLVTNEVKIVFANNDLRVSLTRDTVDACGEGRMIEATHYKSGTISWICNSVVQETVTEVNGTAYIPTNALGTAGTEVTLICESQIGKCKQSKMIPVYIEQPSAHPGTVCWRCGEEVADAAGNSYRTVLMPDNRCWMSTNMRLSTEGSRLYPGADEPTIGRLYTWDAAMKGSTFEGATGICPEGWYVPTYDDWMTLTASLGGETTAGARLKTEENFALPLCGTYNAGTGNFVSLNDLGDYWASTLTGSVASGITLRSDTQAVIRYDGDKNNGLAVRCIKK